ncbi:CDP-glycerol glycerophosphotransferase family protein [Candidatus Entotheonella palauensis]|uniref:CDP-glycerol glycerophosphotransferase family protein n=1 Tax=Candidatus Entotheonella palauensis TaxID=93172 RepID=UPI000B7F7305|nr:CDP-glycerol glycerophosphotransferase family protein [Candidatus Entotheonella palauensis]
MTSYPHMVIPFNQGTKSHIAPKRIGYYLRYSDNLHYFAALQPYLDHFRQHGTHHNALIVRERNPQYEQMPDYAGYTHLLSTNCDLDTYDVVLTPSFLRTQERTPHTRAVQIFHGMSDKPVTYERCFQDYALCLCVGQRQVDRLLQYEHNRTMRWAMIGYPKFDHIPTLPRLFANNRPTIIYCPTWRKGSLSSIEYFLNAPEVVSQLCQSYNVIVKPHPNIFSKNRPYYDQGIVDQLERMPGIKLIRSGNVMPLFQQCDLYIGDISASGYEWLYFHRPMIFLNPRPGIFQASTDVGSKTYLWQCGDVCDDMQDLKALIEMNLREHRHGDTCEDMLHYSVHKPRDHGATRRGLQQIEQLLRTL